MMKKSINWESIHQHIANTQHALEKSISYTDDEINSILHQRAKKLEKEFTSTISQNKLDILEFTLGSEHYGIASNFVNRVSTADKIRRLPSTPEFVEGIINVHGNVICIINLKQFFGMSKLKSNDLNRILIIEYADFKLGILADEVIGIESISLDTIQSSIPTLTGIHSEFLTGITQNQKIIINIPKLIAYKELLVSTSA